MHRRMLAACAAAMLVAACHKSSSHRPPIVEEQADPAEVTVGERLFLETRFAQFFAANMVGGNVNAPLAAGDPTVDTIAKADGVTFTGPFAGQSMNCRQCHLVDELDGVTDGGLRTYGDFGRRSPIPARADGLTNAPRNAPPLVNASLARSGSFFLHFDGEFATSDDLVRGTLTGRNYGWAADEGAQALAHIAKVIREDDGTGALAGDFGALSYADTFAAAPNVPEELLLPAPFQLNVATATDQQILDAVAKLITAYVAQLEFAKDANGEFDGSPFDAFLKKNALPRQPNVGETELAYSRRLRGLVNGLASPVFVTAKDGSFVHHAQTFQFGATELAGFQIFFAEPSAIPPTGPELAAGGIGNCIQCHNAPAFTDFRFHNIGTTQAEYESIHGGGSFNALVIPDLTTRNADPDQFLPPSAAHPTAEGVFRRLSDAGDTRLTDLGVWNILGNPDVPLPQATLHDLIAQQNGLNPGTTTDDVLLPLTIAVFKTPGLRDLADGGPYMHTGQFDEIEDVLGHYLVESGLARAGVVRNGDAQLSGIAITGGDIAALAAFLRSLVEDYD